MNKLGYLSSEYIQIYGGRGEIISWPGHDLHFVKRNIPGTAHFDLINIYPFTCCKSFDAILEFLHSIGKSAITATIITNPLYHQELTEDSSVLSKLRKHFDLINIYKTHHVVHLSEPDFSMNHKRNINEFYSKGGTVSVKNQQLRDMNCYHSLYSQLIEKHNIVDFSDFSKEELIQHFSVPGSVLFEATDSDGTLISWSLFYPDCKDRTVYYHLSASSLDGYRMSASYGIMNEAIQFFKKAGMQKLFLGAAADGNNPGLEYFKSGWGTNKIKNIILGKVFDSKIYDVLSKGKTGVYFPLYRMK